MLFVDTHCHLNYKAYQNDLDEVIQRAVEQCVFKIVVPGLDLESSREALRIADKYKNVYAAVGVYPGEVDKYHQDQLSEFFAMTAHPKVVGIGEIGLDYFHRNDNIEKQLIILRTMLDLADKTHLPVILHSRSSLDALFSVVKDWQADPVELRLKGIFHSFEGDYTIATKITKLGFLLGVGGPVTYKNALIKHELLSKISLSQIVIETDGPFLPPQKHRGKRNEPGFIPLIAEKIAELQKCSVEKVAEVTTSNANNLFNWNG